MQNIHIEPMTLAHVDGVTAVEEACFSIPWTREDFVREAEENKMAIYRVALDGQKVVGFAGMWHIINEGHITNIAVLEDYRGRQIGESLLLALFEAAEEKEMIGITLEVRMGNAPAQAMYAKHGFKAEGIRKKYYAETGEDAVIMWKYFPVAQSQETAAGEGRSS